jgi:endonuclease G, mitochondrial
MRRTQFSWTWIFLILAAIAVYLYLQNLPTGPPVPPGTQAEDLYPHLRWGNPSGATEDTGNVNDFLMKKKYFALAYNNVKGTPNWVSWRVVPTDLGNAPRFPFVPDDTLPPGFKIVVTKDYVGSGFDRGHMCPHSDRASDEEASKATFVMTNIVPQSSANNEKGWAQFEDYCRSLVLKEGKELYVVCGPQGQGGDGKKGHEDFIAGHKITVPAKTWKVVMVLDQGGPVDRSTRLIAVVTPNDETVDEDWSRYRTPVKAVEQLTGYRFFDRADPNIIGPLKDQVDAVRIPAPRPHGH